MSTKGIKYIALSILICFCSCLFKRENNFQRYIDSDFNTYQEIYKIISDSTSYYTHALLKGFTSEYENNWKIDSLICINGTGDKLASLVIISCGVGKDCVSDNVQMLYGKKINNNWYFFKGGGSLVIPRDLYGKNEMNPLSFHELSQISRKEFFAGAIIKKDGKLVVSDEWVNNHFEYNGMCAHCKTHEQYDSTHWQKITGKWQKHFDTTGLKPQKDLP